MASQRPNNRLGGPRKKARPKNMNPTKTVWVTKPSPEKFEDDYTKIAQIGEPGQFGKAFKVKKNSDGKIYCVKEISKARIYRLRPESSTRAHLLISMKDEIDIMRQMNHPYIINIFATYETKHVLHIVMELCTGGELFDRIKKKRFFREEEAKPVVRKICEAIHFMHDKHRVVHCDLKPDNILFVTDAEDSDIKIIDFGMAKVLKRLDSLRALCGTPYYTAPEVIKGDYSHPADMWSIGVIAYTMIFAMVPFYVNPNRFYGNKEQREIYKLIIKGFRNEVKKGLGPWFPEKKADRLSDVGRDFMVRLMEKDTAKRMTAKEALQHEWLKEKDVDEQKVADSEKMDILQVEELANFATGKDFKYAVTALFRDQYQNMRPNHFEELKKQFEALDKDGDGKISYQDFERGMMQTKGLKLDKETIKKIFDGLDINNFGQIRFEDMVNAAVHDYLVQSDARLYEAFRDLDKENDGKIATKDLKTKIQEMNPYGNVDMLLKVIDDVDLDNDGTIDYEEFLHALHPDFQETPNWFWTDDKYKPKKQRNADEKEPDGDDDDVDDDHDDELETVEPATNDQLNGVKSHRSVTGKDERTGKELHIVKDGWMYKQGGFIKTWRNRWFELQNNGIVSYYHNANADYPIARFNCLHFTELKPKSWGKTAQKKFGIKMYTPHRDWKFLCKDEDERKAWMQKFNEVQDANQ